MKKYLLDVWQGETLSTAAHMARYCRNKEEIDVLMYDFLNNGFAINLAATRDETPVDSIVEFDKTIENIVLH